ncbi:MAG: hypothetical protein HOF84_04290 [Rhodospirillales bacterium]|nr:hypothetical protein [Rhodospirillales bacterium]
MIEQPLKLGKQELEFLNGVADGLAETDALTSGGGSGGKIAFAELYAYATDPNFSPAPDLLKALDDDAQLSADFQRLLANTSMLYMPQVAAASSGERQYREADGCRITFKESRADPNQMFVIFELVDKQATPPSIMFICHSDNSCRRVVLSDAIEGRIQLLVDKDSHIVRGLSEVSTEVYLR